MVLPFGVRRLTIASVAPTHAPNTLLNFYTPDMGAMLHANFSSLAPLSLTIVSKAICRTALKALQKYSHRGHAPAAPLHVDPVSSGL